MKLQNICPFQGLCYNLEKVGDLSQIIAPPYDIISPKEQQLYCHKSPYNVIRLELGEVYPSDSAENNRYTRAATTLKDWLKQGILIRGENPAFYIFNHRFSYQGVTQNRWELAASVRLAQWSSGRIRPHEIILPKPAVDRLNLLRSCHVNLSPVLAMLPSEGEGLVSLLPYLVQNETVLEVTDQYGVTHNMWIIDDELRIDKIAALCNDRVLYIADGHHRYETALRYQAEQQLRQPHYTGEERFNFVMINIMDAADPGILMLPTHRLVRLPVVMTPTELTSRLEELFHIQELPRNGSSQEEILRNWLDVLHHQGDKAIALGLYGLDKGCLHLLLPRKMLTLREMLPVEHSEPWRELDVSVLHEIILKGIIGIDSPSREEDSLDYTRDALEAVSRVDSGEYQLAFLINPMPVSSVMAIADAGDRMPQKSTHFYPKPPTGLVMHPVWDENK